MAGGLDFNGAGSAGGPSRPRYDLDALANALANTAENWVPLVFPRGRISDDKSELRLANIKGQPPRNTGSCVVSLRGDRAGSFFDYDGGASGGPLATLKEATGLSGKALFDRAAELSHYRPDAAPAQSWNRPAPKPIDAGPEIAHILARAKPAPGSLVETYLASRKLPCPASADLLFCNNVSDFKAGVGRPAMIAIVRGADGKPTGGIHRTFLAYDGAGKAPMDKPKKMLGAIQNGAVRLAPVGGDGILGVAEGIETAIAAMTIHGVPVWAALGANNLGGYDKAGAWTGFELPLDVKIRHLVIFADSGGAGEAAAAALRDRVSATGIAVDIEFPTSGDDFNADLLGKNVNVGHVSQFTNGRSVQLPEMRDAATLSAESLGVPSVQSGLRPPMAQDASADARTKKTGHLSELQPHAFKAWPSGAGAVRDTGLHSGTADAPSRLQQSQADSVDVPPASSSPPRIDITTPATGAEDIAHAIGALGKDSHHEEITAALRLIVQARPNPIALRQMINSVKDRTKIPARALETVLRELIREAPPPSPIPGNGSAAPSEWMREIIMSENGEPKPLLENAAVAFENAPEWKNVIWLDEFSERIMLRAPPPWHVEGDEFSERPWTDNDDYMATRWLQRAGIHVQTPTTHEAVLSSGFRNPYHPVREYLAGLKWDGVDRLDFWVSDHLGAEETPYTKAVGARWMISAVARIMQPGIKVDHMLILEGPQEKGKSTALRALFDPWFSDGMSELGSKDAAIELAGVWLIEFAELDAMRRVERNRLKAFITRAADRYRPPWGRHAIDHPRQMVFAGSVNDETYLDDPTGARRFWPIKIGEISVDSLWRARDQLWAEALHRYDAGERFYLHEADLKGLAQEQQAMRQIEDAWHRRIRRFLDGADDSTFPKDNATVDIVLGGLHIPLDRWDRVAQNRVIAFFTAHKWERRMNDSETFYYRPRDE